MLSRLLRYCLFHFIHFIVSVLVAVQNVYHRFRIRSSSSSGDGVKNNVMMILKHMPNMNKKPKHLVLLADTKQHSLKDLASVVIWSLVAGIPYISFHDITGELSKEEDKLFLEVEHCKIGIPGCIKWSHMPNLNGYTNGAPAHTITINIFTKHDGRPKIASCIRKMVVNKYKPECHDINAQELDEVLKMSYPQIPEPDLVMYTGVSCCTHGLLPWHIRLAEFINISIDHSIKVDSYIGALYKYNKCDQRFGK